MIKYGQMCGEGSGKTKWFAKKESNKVQMTVNA